MKKADYEARMIRPLLYIRIVAVCLVVFNLFLPIINNSPGYKVLIQWLIVLLVGVTVIIAQGGLGTLFFVKDADVPLNTWTALRFLEIVGVWIWKGIGSFTIYFWILLALDACFIYLVVRDKMKYRYFEKGE